MITPQGFLVSGSEHGGGCQNFPAESESMHPHLAAGIFPEESLFPQISATSASHGITMATGNERTGHQPMRCASGILGVSGSYWDGNTGTTGMGILGILMIQGWNYWEQTCCCTHHSRDLLGFPFLLLEGLIIPYCQGRRCCPLEASPADKGLVEGCVPSWAWPGAVPPCPQRALERSDLRGSSTPRQLGRLQNPHDVCWELLQHARRSHPSLSPAPRTTGPASSGAGAARTPCPPRGSGRCSGPPRAHPAGRGAASHPQGFPPYPRSLPFLL